MCVCVFVVALVDDDNDHNDDDANNVLSFAAAASAPMLYVYNAMQCLADSNSGGH